MHWLDTLLAAVAVAVTIPAWVFVFECFLGLLPPSRRAPDEGEAPSVAILIPAHDERLVIAPTVRALNAQLKANDRILVVADNCSDETAELARAEGASVVERHDTERRGKGYALVFGMEQLADDPPDVVVVVDADCEVSMGGIHTIARLAQDSGRPVQAEYLMAPPSEPSPRSVVSALAFLVRNRVRPRGLHRLGFPCHLTGSGMAFPYQVLRDAPATGSYLVEDLLMGIELALIGQAPLLCTQATVTSELPSSDNAAAGQRRRWEHGQLLTLIRQAPRLVGLGLVRARFDLLALGLDLMVPPLALLVLMLLGTLVVLALASVLAGTTLSAPALVLSAVVAMGVAVGLSWLRFARASIPFKYLLAIPLYVLWKVPLYLSFFLRKRQKTWERTERDNNADDDG